MEYVNFFSASMEELENIQGNVNVLRLTLSFLSKDTQIPEVYETVLGVLQSMNAADREEVLALLDERINSGEDPLLATQEWAESLHSRLEQISTERQSSLLPRPDSVQVTVIAPSARRGRLEYTTELDTDALLPLIERFDEPTANWIENSMTEGRGKSIQLSESGVVSFFRAPGTPTIFTVDWEQEPDYLTKISESIRAGDRVRMASLGDIRFVSSVNGQPLEYDPLGFFIMRILCKDKWNSYTVPDRAPQPSATSSTSPTQKQPAAAANADVSSRSAPAPSPAQPPSRSLTDVKAALYIKSKKYGNYAPMRFSTADNLATQIERWGFLSERMGNVRVKMENLLKSSSSSGIYSVELSHIGTVTSYLTFDEASNYLLITCQLDAAADSSSATNMEILRNLKSSPLRKDECYYVQFLDCIVLSPTPEFETRYFTTLVRLASHGEPPEDTTLAMATPSEVGQIERIYAPGRNKDYFKVTPPKTSGPGSDINLLTNFIKSVYPARRVES